MNLRTRSREHFVSPIAALCTLLFVSGCSTEIVDVSTVLCQPGARKCDDTSTRVLECHPNGAAWVLVQYCSDKAFCVNGACTGDDPVPTNDAVDLSTAGTEGSEETSTSSPETETDAETDTSVDASLDAGDIE